MTPELLSVEAWGGATYDVALRFLGEDPWERLAALREALPNITIQMLLRGRNTVGYTPYPTEVTDAFVREAAATRRRHLPHLRRAERRRPDAPGDRRGARHRHAVAEVAALLHRRPARPRRGPLHARLLPAASPSRSSTPARTSSRSRTWRGSCGRRRPRSSSRALRERFDLPVHVHTHDTAGGQLATLLAASRAGVDAVDVASAPMAGTTSQPSASALVAALAHTERDTGHLARRRSPTSSRTGRPCAASTSRSSRACPAPPAACTTTRSRAASSRTCASRRSRWASPTTSSSSRTCTPRPTTSSAACRR